MSVDDGGLEWKPWCSVCSEKSAIGPAALFAVGARRPHPVDETVGPQSFDGDAAAGERRVGERGRPVLLVRAGGADHVTRSRAPVHIEF